MKILLVILLSLSLFGGIYLAINMVRKKLPPLSAAHIHGIVGILLLIVLSTFAFQNNNSRIWISLGFLILTSLGGLYLVSEHKKDKVPPISALAMHVLFAFIGITLLAWNIF